MGMDYQYIMHVCNNLGEMSIRMRKPNDWYVNHRGVEVKNGGCLEDRYGNGNTPQDAIIDHWKKLTVLAPHEYIVCCPLGGGERKA